MQRSDEELRIILHRWQEDFSECRFIDSSHGEDDVRENYILDQRLVLRVNSAHVMTDERLKDLNKLVARYRAFGLAAPCFLPLKQDDRFLLPLEDGTTCYLSEYLDMPTAEQSNDPLLDWKILKMTSAFASRYQDVDLSGTYGMYSLFDLSPYDIPIGMDEKQDNCNQLCDALAEGGEMRLAERLRQLNDEIRERLKAYHPRLPKCVFQGDENGSNLCLDSSGEIAGIFDFNMAGTDVCINYLANHALCGWECEIEDLQKKPAERLAQDFVKAASDGTKVVQAYYAMNEEEKLCWPLYLMIVALFQWPCICTYRVGLQKEETHGNTAALLQYLADAAQGLLEA